MNWLRILVRNWLGIEADRRQHQEDHARWHEEGKREHQRQFNEQATRYAQQQQMTTDKLLAGWQESLTEHAQATAFDEFWKAALGSGKSPDEAYKLARECMEIRANANEPKKSLAPVSRSATGEA